MSNLLHRARFALDHRWAPARMSDYLDGELGSSSRTRMEGHIAQCQECRGVLTGLRHMLDALHRLPVPGGGDDAVEVAAAVRLRLQGGPRSK